MKLFIILIILTSSGIAFADRDKIIVDPDSEQSSQITWDLETGDLDALDVERYTSGGASVYSFDENKFYDVEGYGDGSYDTYGLDDDLECCND